MVENTDVFISYNFLIKDKVKKLGEELTRENLKVWKDERDLETNEKPLTNELTDAIKNSKLFVCCITKSYCESHNCNCEIDWVKYLAKPLVVLMVENLDLEQEIQVVGKKYTSDIPYII